jgi:glycosyltransferase involved in cell wall biosynthesis
MNNRLVASISVAMATFNGAAHLEPQWASILAQSRLPSELVMSDDGSDDGTRAQLERFAAVAPFPVRMLHGPERLGVTRNFGRALTVVTAS